MHGVLYNSGQQSSGLRTTMAKMGMLIAGREKGHLRAKGREHQEKEEERESRVGSQGMGTGRGPKEKPRWCRRVAGVMQGRQTSHGGWTPWA